MNNPKILIVDDDKFLTDLLSVKFKNAGFEVSVINDPGHDFVDQVLNFGPGLISLDIIMPRITGYEAIQMLKADQRTKDIPVIFLSNFSQGDSINKCVSLGAVDFFVNAFMIPSFLVKSYTDYLNDPENYIKRYPVYLEAQKMELPDSSSEELDKVRSAYIEKHFLELGIK